MGLVGCAKATGILPGCLHSPFSTIRPTAPEEKGDSYQEHLTAQSPSLLTTQVLLQLTKFPFPYLGGFLLQCPQSKPCPPLSPTPPVAALQMPAPGIPAGPAMAQLGQWASRAGGNFFSFLPLV